MLGKNGRCPSSFSRQTALTDFSATLAEGSMMKLRTGSGCPPATRHVTLIRVTFLYSISAAVVELLSWTIRRPSTYSCSDFGSATATTEEGLTS